MSNLNQNGIRQEIAILQDQLKSLGSLSPENQHLLQQFRSALEGYEKPKEIQVNDIDKTKGHTPEPWHSKVFSDGAFIIADGPVGDLKSCIIASRNEHPDPAASRANGELIALAPTLLRRAQTAERQRDKLLLALEGIVEHQDTLCRTALTATKVMAVNAIEECELDTKGETSERHRGTSLPGHQTTPTVGHQKIRYDRCG